MSEYQGSQSPEEIEREIQRTRARMGRDIDALGEKLSPENLKQQAKDAVAEKAQDMVANAGQQARRTGSRLVEFVRENPLPVAAVGLGVTWLFTLRTRSEVSGDRMARFAYTGPERRTDGHTSLGRRLVDRTARMREKVGGAAAEVSDRAGDLADRAGDVVDRVQERAGDLGTTAKRKMQEQTERARGGLEEMMEKNPLALVAGAAILGLALGLVLPESRREQRLMGSQRDQLADRVQTTFDRVKDAAVEAGREVSQVAKDEAAHRAPELKDSLKDAAATIGEQVKESASRVAQEAKQAAIRPDDAHEPDTM